MPDLNSLFQAASVVGGSNSEPSFLIIDHDFRTIDIPPNKKLLGVTSDERINYLYFKGPQYYEGSDLSTFAIRVVYLNARGESDIYVAPEVNVVDGELRFTWEVGRHACLYSGNVRFIVQAVLTDSDGYILKKYNTRIHSLPVVEGIEPDEGILLANYDLITQFAKNIQRAYKIDDYVSDAEAYALGTRGGVAVEEDDITYENNAKYYAQSISEDEASMRELVLDAEAWAIGTRNGLPVSTSDPAFDNNAKYYMTATKAALSTKIDIFYDTVEGTMIEVEDGAEAAPLKTAELTIIPTPDLHGYSKPWPGGTTRNQLKLNGSALPPTGGFYIEIKDNGEVFVTGTTYDIYYYAASTGLNTSELAGMKFTVNAVNGISWRITSASSNIALQELSKGSIIEDHGTNCRLVCRLSNGIEFQNVSLQPSIVPAGNNSTVFVPYENRCDIPALDYITFTRTSAVNSNVAHIELEQFLPSYKNERIPFYGGVIEYISGTSAVKYAKASALKSDFGNLIVSGSGFSYREVTFNNLPVPSSETNLEAAQSSQTCNIATISNPDVDTTHGEYLAYVYTNLLSNVPVLRISEQLYQAIDATTPVEVVYEIAEEIPFQLPHGFMPTELGYNKFYCNGATMSLEYPVDIKSYIDKKIDELRELIEGDLP